MLIFNSYVNVYQRVLRISTMVARKDPGPRSIPPRDLNNKYATSAFGKTYRFLCVPYRFRRFHPKTKMQPPLHIYIINANFDGISYGCYEANRLGLQMPCTRRFLPCHIYRLIGGAIWNYQSGQYDYLEILWGVLL